MANPDGTDTATSGSWAIGKPAQVAADGAKQLGTTVSGRYDLVTGAAAGISADANDLDGVTTIRSAPVQLPATPGPMTFRHTFAHDAAATADDWLRVWVETPDGTRTLVFEQLGMAAKVDATWTAARVDMAPFAGQKVRTVIGAADGGTDDLVEAAVDDLRIELP